MRNPALLFKFSILLSQRYNVIESKTILYLETVYCKFLLYVSVEVNPFEHRYFSTQTNLVYLGLVYVTMIIRTRSKIAEVQVCYWSINSLFSSRIMIHIT